VAAAKSTVIYSQCNCDVPMQLEVVCIYEFWLTITELRKITTSPVVCDCGFWC